jgi:hypothetical protein
MNIKGFSYETWYNMPVHLRSHYLSVIKKKVEEQNKRIKKQARSIYQDK